jgi:hypothetical protein
LVCACWLAIYIACLLNAMFLQRGQHSLLLEGSTSLLSTIHLLVVTCSCRPNRRNEKWSRVKLYLLSQVEAKSFALYGSEDGLDKEFDKREATKRDRSSAKQVRRQSDILIIILIVFFLTVPLRPPHSFFSPFFPYLHLERRSSHRATRASFTHRRATSTFVCMRCRTKRVNIVGQGDEAVAKGHVDGTVDAGARQARARVWRGDTRCSQRHLVPSV